MATFEPIRSKLAPLVIPDVDTDQIIPARYLKVTTKEGLAEGLFADWRYDPSGVPRPDFLLNRAEHSGAQLLLVGHNFGCGSSREHAPWALVGYGFRAVLGLSFADIFRGNALKNGLVPVVLPADYHAALASRVSADPAFAVEVDLRAEEVRAPGFAPQPFTVDPFARRCLLDGVDELGYLLARQQEIQDYETRTDRAATPAR